jgi:peptide deformylase
MAIREILTYPKDKTALRRSSTTISEMNNHVKQLIIDLKDTLQAHPHGIGLAAPQINIHRRVVIVRLGVRNEEGIQYGAPFALVNPTILEARDERRDHDGCLSFPNLYGETVRPHYLRVSGIDEEGNDFEKEYEGFDAVTVHHEIDHLDGILFIDHIDSIQDLYRVDKNDDGELVRVPFVIEVR